MDLPSNPEATRFADQLERSYRGGAWHGPALAEALDGVGAEAADLRPLEGSHSVREIVEHVAFWLDGARRRIEGEALDGLDPEADWPADRDGSTESWQRALERLEHAHRSLRAAVLALDDADLDRPVAGSDPTLRGMLLGVLQHTAYHAGQIRILARVAPEPTR